MEGEKTMKKGVFYSVGVGPGDPELITLKAVRTLERCPVVAAPQTKNGEMLALSIARQAVSLKGKTVVPLHFTMSRDKAQQHAAAPCGGAGAAAASGRGAGRRHAQPGRRFHLRHGPPIWRTFWPPDGYETRMVPGVTSFCAVAARLNTSLTGIDTPLHIVPGGCGATRRNAWRSRAPRC